MDVHEILVAPESRVDATGRVYRYVAIAAWNDDAAKQRGDGITRRIAGRDITAELFNDFRIYYEEVVQLVVTRQGAVEREWQRVNGAWVVESQALLINEDAQTAQRKWKREPFARDMQAEAQGCIDRYLARARQKGYVGDRRGTTLNLEIAASLDDAQETDADSGFTATGPNFTNTSSATASSRRNVGFRFQNVTIPVGATINSCVLQVNVTNTATDDPNLKLYFNNVDDAANFSTEADVTNRAKTTAFVSWVATAVGTGYKSSPDLSVPCQEWVDRSGRVSGNACCVLSEGNSDSTKNFTYDAWDNGANVLHAKLDIDYTAASAFTATAALTAGAATLASSATFAPGTKTATAALTAGAASLSGAATFVKPTYTATAAMQAGPATLAASATSAAATFTATAALSVSPATLAASATHVVPTYTATSALTAGAATLAGTATFAAPVYTATASLSAGAATLSASVTFTTPTYTATCSLIAAASTLAGSGAFSKPVYTASAALTAQPATMAATALHTVPSFTATASLTVGQSTLASTATFAGLNTATAALTAQPASLSGAAMFAQIRTATAQFIAGAATLSVVASFSQEIAGLVGLEYTAPARRFHFVSQDGLLHYTSPAREFDLQANDNKFHGTAPSRKFHAQANPE